MRILLFLGQCAVNLFRLRCFSIQICFFYLHSVAQKLKLRKTVLEAPFKDVALQ
jgi:hypothetical protein